MSEKSTRGTRRQPGPKKHVWWLRRPTIRTLKARAELEAIEFGKSLSHRDNDATRLPHTESVHLGGLVLVEAFTPSSISKLDRAAKNLLSKQESYKKLLASIAQSRRSGSNSLHNFSLFRPGVGLVDSENYRNPELPEGIDAVWLQFNCTVPSLTTVVATFTLSEDAGDLSVAMRRDYLPNIQNLRIRVFGRAAWIRQMIPWARPRIHGPTYSSSMASFEKYKACTDSIDHHREACERWFYKRFSGRFSSADRHHRPAMHLLFTTERTPFTEGSKWLQSVGLDRGFDLWRSSDDISPGWFLSFDSWPRDKGRHTVTFAARRQDVAKTTRGEQDGPTNWFLTQDFGAFQAPLAARYAMSALLALYSDELGSIRDRAGIKRWPQRTVREAKLLERYLIGDGLDAATVTSDIRALTDDSRLFRWQIPEYIEIPKNSKSREIASKEPAVGSITATAKRLRKYLKISPMQREKENQESELKSKAFSIALCETLNKQATHLARDTAATTGNIRASAELRQSMANTRLQRIVLFLSIIAIIVSIATAVVT